MLRQQKVGWLGIENDRYCRRSILYLCCGWGWSEKLQKYANVLEGWSPRENMITLSAIDNQYPPPKQECVTDE